ncbi:MAG TPA: succinate dehydrogenase, hydrophobic membrane anchor protein [Burkholderiaceae bacterium]|nr:succinate dehydrogenase, hydrophobic membrane anchor protein [Burkholderiaceae bacterium]
MPAQRIVTGAHYGVRDWLAQRITAVVLLLYIALLLGWLLTVPAVTFDSWAGLFATGWMKVATMVAMLALVYHTWVGMRDIYMDYLKPTGLRLFAQAATIVVLIGYGFWTVLILWRV